MHRHNLQLHLIICSLFLSFKNLTTILDKSDDVEPNYTDDSTCIQKAEKETCEVQRDGLVTSIGMPEDTMLIYKQKAQQLSEIFCVCICMQQYK